MAEKSCRVTVSDMDGTAHTVQITASTLYEAVARGLAAIRGNEWVAGIAQGLNVVKVSVASVSIERQVKMQDFTNWLDRKGGSPRDVADRQRVRSIPGCAKITEGLPREDSRVAFAHLMFLLSIPVGGLGSNCAGVVNFKIRT